jgi:hypothetical protein
MAGTRAPFASLAALAAVASASAQTQSGETSATESARRDLQSLPAVQRPVDAATRSSPFSGSSAVPALSLPAPSGATPAKNRDEANAPRSTNWLLDGVNQLEAETESARKQADELAKREDVLQRTGTNGRTESTATTNPFSEYLTQWLSPGDQALLAAGSRNTSSSSTAPWETPRSEFGRDTTQPTTSTTANPLQLELPGLGNFADSRRNQNPYLADPFQAEEFASVPVGGPATGRETSGTLPSILTPSQGSLPPAAPVIAPIEQARPAPAAAPTDRLIDDRKYFPQLRRF